MEKNSEDIHQEMRAVEDYLVSSSHYKLDVETVTWSLMAMRANPQLTVSQAMAIGYYEWVK